MESVKEVLMSFKTFVAFADNIYIDQRTIDAFIEHQKLRPREPRADGLNEQAKEFCGLRQGLYPCQTHGITDGCKGCEYLKAK